MKTVLLCGGPFANRTIHVADTINQVTIRDTIVNRRGTAEAVYVECVPPRTGADGAHLWRISPTHAVYERVERTIRRGT